MGVGYDDDTLRAEHEQREQWLREKKQTRISIVGFLAGAWVVIGSFVWIGAESLSENAGGAVFALGFAVAVSIWLVTFYLAAFME